MTVKTKELRDLLIRLKKVHRVYVVATEDQKRRLFDASQHLIDQITSFGFDKTFVETLLIGGKDFLESLYGEGKEVASDYDAEIIF